MAKVRVAPLLMCASANVKQHSHAKGKNPSRFAAVKSSGQAAAPAAKPATSELVGTAKRVPPNPPAKAPSYSPRGTVAGPPNLNRGGAAAIVRQSCAVHRQSAKAMRKKRERTNPPLLAL